MIVGHAQTVSLAKQRAVRSGGKLIVRLEDLDSLRCKSLFFDEMIEDLHWMGLDWDWGFGSEQPCSIISTETIATYPFLQASSIDDNSTATEIPTDEISVPVLASESLALKTSTSTSFDLFHLNATRFRQTDRMELYLKAFRYLLAQGCIYPSSHSRRDVDAAISAPHEGDREIIFPPSLRPSYLPMIPGIRGNVTYPIELRELVNPKTLGVNWRFRVPDGVPIEFVDGINGPQSFISGEDFGDFVVWRGVDNIPSYEFSVVVDDATMGVTEVVRGEDLLLSTARQLLLYQALGVPRSAIPSFYHCPLVRNAEGIRLAKRAYSQTIRSLRESGYTAERIAKEFFDPCIYEEYISIKDKSEL